MTDLEQRAARALFNVKANHPKDRQLILTLMDRVFSKKLRASFRIRLWNAIYTYRRQIEDEYLIIYAAEVVDEPYKPRKSL